MSGFEFIEQPAPNADVVVDARITSKQQLLEHLAQGLSFPDYFGENWDALVDCLSDLSWVEKPEVVIAHAALPALPPAELRTYLLCLSDVVARMTPEDVPKLRLQFRAADQAAVQAIVA